MPAAEGLEHEHEADDLSGCLVSMLLDGAVVKQTRGAICVAQQY